MINNDDAHVTSSLPLHLNNHNNNDDNNNNNNNDDDNQTSTFNKIILQKFGGIV